MDHEWRVVVMGACLSKKKMKEKIKGPHKEEDEKEKKKYFLN